MGKKKKSQVGAAEKHSEKVEANAGSIESALDTPKPQSGINGNQEINPGSDVITKARTVFLATVCHHCKAVPKNATGKEPGNRTTVPYI